MHYQRVLKGKTKFLLGKKSGGGGVQYNFFLFNVRDGVERNVLFDTHFNLYENQITSDVRNVNFEQIYKVF